MMRAMLLSVDPTGFWNSEAATMLAGLAALAVGYWWLRGRNSPAARRKRRGDPLADMPQRQSLAQQRNLERDMQQLLVQLNEMAREMNAQIDTRAAKLEALIAEADTKIAALQGQPSPPTVARPADDPPAGDGPADAPDPADAGVGNLAPTRRHSAIYDLADAGADVEDIARQTDRPRGEIELILALRRG